MSSLPKYSYKCRMRIKSRAGREECGEEKNKNCIQYHKTDQAQIGANDERISSQRGVAVGEVGRVKGQRRGGREYDTIS